MKYALFSLLVAATGALGASVPVARSGEVQAARPGQIGAPCDPNQVECYCFRPGVSWLVGECLVAKCPRGRDLDEALIDASSTCENLRRAHGWVNDTTKMSTWKDTE
ncbi:hypothetical protein HDZ31DRAFT_76389 [Schizophyllum fasciatum]